MAVTIKSLYNNTSKPVDYNLGTVNVGGSTSNGVPTAQQNLDAYNAARGVPTPPV